MQSGSASRILTRSQANALTQDLFGVLGLASGDMAGLRLVSPADLVAAQDKVLASDLGDRNGPGGKTFGIVLDGQTLPEHPLAAIARGDLGRHALVLITTRDEARLWFRLGVMRELHDAQELRAEIAGFTGDGASATQLLPLYARPGEALAQARERFLTHAVYRVPALRTALAQTRAGGSAWLARFDWTPAGEWAPCGASHGFDEPFAWGKVDPSVYRYTEGAPDAPGLAARMVASLKGLAHHGNPGWPVWTETSPEPSRWAMDGHAAQIANESDDEEADLLVWRRCGLLDSNVVLKA